MQSKSSKSRGVVIAGNWKMNHGRSETIAFFNDLKAKNPLKRNGLEICVFPAYLYLENALAQSKQLPFQISIGAQNAHWEKKGAFTGEVSGSMLQEIGVHWSLVGHSERRQYFGETDETVRKRSQSLLDQGFKVILCVGEVKSEREQGKTADVVTRQLNAAIHDAKYLNDGGLILAYEPVWAIGTGLTATPQQAEEAHQIIRKNLWDRFGMEAAGRTCILYGGSVTAENAASLLACPNVDGLLVGGASLKAESFYSIIEAGMKALG